MTRSSRLQATGLVETEPRAESRVFEPLVLLNTPDGLSYIVLGRYNGTVVAWARLQIKVETPCHSADAQRAKLLHGYSIRTPHRKVNFVLLFTDAACV